MFKRFFNKSTSLDKATFLAKAARAHASAHVDATDLESFRAWLIRAEKYITTSLYGADVRNMAIHLIHSK